MTEGKRFSPCWRRSSEVPLVVEHFPSLTACIPTPVYPLLPTGALSKKAFHKETGEEVRRKHFRDNSPRAGLTTTNPHFVTMLHQQYLSAEQMSQVLHIIFRHLPLPVCLPPSSSTRLSLPSHLVIELGIKTIKRVTVPSFQDSPKNVNLYRNSSLHAGKKKTTPHFVTMQQHNVCRTDVSCPPRSPPSCSKPPIRVSLYYYT